MFDYQKGKRKSMKIIEANPIIRKDRAPIKEPKVKKDQIISINDSVVVARKGRARNP